VTLSATSPDAGSASEEIEVEYKDTAPRDRLQLALPAGHRRTGRKAASEARFLLADAASPTIIVTMPTTRALYVLMPMRV
jgi:DNA polymerase-3 subunit beta